MFKKYVARRFLAEELDCSLICRIQALLSYDGVKPSSMFPYSGDLELNKIFEDFGMNAEVKKYRRSPILFIARDNNYLGLVVNAFENFLKYRCESKGFYRASYDMGAVLGYPETAITAYQNQKYFRNKDERKIIKRLMLFFNSREFYNAERLTALKWEKHIALHYPKLYLDFFLETYRIRWKDLRYCGEKAFQNFKEKHLGF
ncbi:MAG: hypothetical protein U9Q69_02465 [Nanoarchaeota archaeon]|nr:hypothetical protein [Nanoarchaeota archaeon]